MEKLHFGWLTKSPPKKKQRLFPAKWRRRYFVLYVPPSSAFLPGKACTAILDYYSNEKMVKKRGSVDLVKCHSIISNFDPPKHMFIMKTVHKDKERDYYLASDSKKEMEDWVNILHDVVGLNKESFSCVTATRHMGISHTMAIPSKANSVQLHKQPLSCLDGYFDLKDCTAGNGKSDMNDVSPSYLNEMNQIQICRLPAAAERKKASSDGSSVRTDSNEFTSLLITDDVYNIPKNNQPLVDEYKVPKLWPNSLVSASSGIDDSFARETYGSPSSSSTSSAAINDYDVPPPKPHLPPTHNYANTGSHLTHDSKNIVPTSPHEVPLPLKVKTSKHNKKDVAFHNGSSSSDAFKREKNYNKISSGCSSSSSSSSEDDEVEGIGTPSSITEGVYSLPGRRSSGAEREQLPSVFEEGDTEKPNSSLPPVTKVEYLHLDFSDDLSTLGDVQSQKPPSLPVSNNKVEYREIDFEKTRALSELRVNREITKSQ